MSTRRHYRRWSYFGYGGVDAGRAPQFRSSSSGKRSWSTNFRLAYREDILFMMAAHMFLSGRANITRLPDG